MTDLRTVMPCPACKVRDKRIEDLEQEVVGLKQQAGLLPALVESRMSSVAICAGCLVDRCHHHGQRFHGLFQFIDVIEKLTNADQNGSFRVHAEC